MLKQLPSRLTKIEATTIGGYVVIVPDSSSDGMVVGRDCVRLTKKYKRFGVTCHALPDIVDVNNVPVFAIFGPTKSSVQRALTAYLTVDGEDPPSLAGIKITAVPMP